MISKGVLEKIQLIWPADKLQLQFVKIFKDIQRIRSRMDEAEAGNLIAALQNKLLEYNN